MDWGNVTVEDLIGALREVEWSAPPRPASEFFSKFALPRSSPKWNSRLKCNLYYYRTNYFILTIFVLGVACLLSPLAMLATALAALSIAFLNDSFAATVSEKGNLFACLLFVGVLQPKIQYIFVASHVDSSLVLWYTTGFLFSVSWALGIALLVIVLHASFRTPNLKARLNTFREEFRAVWRNYSEL